MVEIRKEKQIIKQVSPS